MLVSKIIFYYLVAQLEGTHIQTSIAFNEWTIGSVIHYNEQAVGADAYTLRQRGLSLMDYGLEAIRIRFCQHC